MASSSDALGPAVIAIGQSVGAFQFFLPHLSEVRKSSIDTNPDVAGDVRLGEVAASALTLGIGFMVTSLSGSAYPMYVAVLMCFILVCVYETALRSNLPLQPKKTTVSDESTS